jgi:hypothetical protein
MNFPALIGKVPIRKKKDTPGESPLSPVVGKPKRREIL